MIPLLLRLENTGGEGENAGYQHFLLLQQCFPKPSSEGSLKVGIVWERVYACIDSCQPAKSAQAKTKRNYSPFLNFLHVKGPSHL